MDAKLISISSDIENSFVVDLVQKNVPKVALYGDFVVKNIIFLGFFFTPVDLNGRSRASTIEDLSKLMIGSS